MNSVMLMGKVIDEVKCKKENNKTITSSTIAVKRTYKNNDGSITTDNLPLIFSNNLSDSARKYLHKDLFIAVKGTIVENDKKPQIIVNSMTFLKTKEA